MVSTSLVQFAQADSASSRAASSSPLLRGADGSGWHGVILGQPLTVRFTSGDGRFKVFDAVTLRIVDNRSAAGVLLKVDEQVNHARPFQ